MVAGKPERITNKTVYDGCLFAVGKRIFAWHHGMNQPKQVVERPELVTSIESGFSHKPYQSFIWDSCNDGAVRVDLSEEVVAKFNQSVASVMYMVYDVFGPDYLAAQKENRFAQPTTDEHLLVYLVDHRHELERGWEFTDSKGRRIGFVEPKNICPTQAIATHSLLIFWINDGVVYRGVTNREIDVRISHESGARLVPFGTNFFVVHYHNDDYNPEGVLLTARDRRTVISWDPGEYGYPEFTGIYEHDDKPWLLFSHTEYEKHTSVYTMPFRTKDGIRVPSLVGLIPFEEKDNHTRNYNPFCAVDLEHYSQYFQ